MTLPADQLPPDLRTLPEKVARLERELRELRAARPLEHSSIDGGALLIKDSSGTVRARLGNQPDGTVALAMVTGPTPPVPTAPVVGEELAALSVTWDGAFADNTTLPADWLRCEVHVGSAADFTVDQSTLRATIETPQGGSVLLALSYAQWWVRLRAVTTSGAVSAATDAVPGTPRQAGGDDISADAINGKTITGALIRTAASGGRIELDSAEGAIEVYAADGSTITNYVGGDDNIIYNIGGDEFVALFNGSVVLGWDGDVSDPTDTSATLSIIGDGSGVSILSPVNATLTQQNELRVVPGVTSAMAGATTSRHVQTSGDIWAAGVVVKSEVPVGSSVSQPVTWQTPTYASGWTGGSSASSRYGAFQVRKDAEDNLHCAGVFRATGAMSAGAHTVGTLPDGHVPADLQPAVAIHMSSTDVIRTVCRVAIDNTGAIGIATTSAIASGDAFYFTPFVVPLGNIA